jgi:16S rRNA (guanine966-N2)-methyltransferase
MRILAGVYKGKLLSAGPNLSIRPMTNKNRETIFSILDDFFVKRKVLDLFCGSGTLGLEALSRGAESVTFIEREKTSLSVLKKNIIVLKPELQKIKIESADVLRYLLKENARYRLVFADPPFNYDKLQLLVDMIFSRKILEPGGVLILHHEKTNLFRRESSLYKFVKQKKAGRSLISILTEENANV